MMTNISLEIEDDVLERVAFIAEQKGTTVEAIVLEFLTTIALREESRKKLLLLMAHSEGRMAPNWKFNRDASYDR